MQAPTMYTAVMPLKQQQHKYPKRPFNLPISNKSNTQYQQQLKYKNEITIKINKLSELIIHDEPKIYYTKREIDFSKRDLDSLALNLPLINNKKLIKPIRTRQFLCSTYRQSYDESHNGTFKNSTKNLDPMDSIILANHAKFEPLMFDKSALKLSENGCQVEILMEENATPLRKRPIKDLENAAPLPKTKKRHRYDIPLENSRAISAKEVLRMVDSSLISSDMDLSQNNSTSTSFVLNDISNTNNNNNVNTPLKPIPSYLKFFNGNVLNETPLKNSILSSTPQSKFLNLQDEEFKYSPINGSKLKNM